MRNVLLVVFALAGPGRVMAGESGPYLVGSNGRVVTVAYRPGGGWVMTDENGRAAEGAVAADGRVSWGGKVRPNGDIDFAGNSWYRVSGLYRVASNGKIARVEGLPDGRTLLVDENGKRSEVLIHGNPTFSAFGTEARLELTAGGLVIQWPGNQWVKVGVRAWPAPNPISPPGTQPTEPTTPPPQTAKDYCRLVPEKDTVGTSLLMYVVNTSSDRPIKVTVACTESAFGGGSRRLADKVVTLPPGGRAFCGGTKSFNDTYTYSIARAVFE